MNPSIVYETHALIYAILGSAGIIGGASAVGLSLSPKITERVLPKPEENRLADFLPFDRILADGETILCKGSTLTRYIGILGKDQTFITDEEQDSLIRMRQAMYDSDSIKEKGIILRIFTIRKPLNLEQSDEYPNPLVKAIANRWNTQFKRSFRSRTIIGVSIKGTSEADAESLREACNAIQSTLKEFSPSIISTNPESSPWGDTTISSILSEIISPISMPKPTETGEHMSDSLVGDEVAFLKNGRIRFRNGNKTKYAVNIGIKRYGDRISTAMTERIASMPYETIISQTIVPMSKMKSLVLMKQNQMMMKAGAFGSSQVVAQYQATIEMIEGNAEEKTTLCLYSQNIFIFADTEEELDTAEETCREILSTSQVTAISEKGATQAAWFSQFPTYEDRPRQYRFLSQNVALSCTFSTPPEGLWKSAWGPRPITLLHTGANTTYAFQFQQSDGDAALGHGVCIAGSGMGKTVLMEFLSCMASQNKRLKHFFFDRHKGTYVYTTAMGGRYLALNAPQYTMSINSGMNPFLMPDTISNRSFLKLWLHALSGLPSDDEDAAYQCTRVVDTAYDTLPDEYRSLDKFFDTLFSPGTEIYKRLKPWIDPAGYGPIFNASTDSLDVSEGWLTTFDMTNLMDDIKLAGPSISYIMHRIRQIIETERVPTFIFIDETEPMLADESFRRIYLQMLQEFRKLGAVVISVFQRVEALEANRITQALTANSGALYLFQNPSGQEKDYAHLNLTEREMNFVLSRSGDIRSSMTKGGGSNRKILIKRPQTRESVILDIDLEKPLGPLLNIFSSSANKASKASDLQSQFGPDWVRHYIND